MQILITPRSFAAYDKTPIYMLKDAGFEVILNPKGRPLLEEELVELLADAVGIIVGTDKMTARVLENAPNLKVISKYGVGIDNIDIDAATARKIIVTITPGVNTISVAELTFGLMIAAARKIVNADRLVRDGKWSSVIGIELAGKTLGIMGLGRIGKEVAKRAVVFEMRVLAFDEVQDPVFAEKFGIEYVDFETILTTSDFISIHLPLTEKTRYLIGEKELRKMKPNAIIINTARGGIIDEKALVRALKEGWISGAALDVYEVEPPVNQEIFSLPNVVLTPHIGAHTIEAVNKMGIQAAYNLITAIKGCVDPEVVVNKSVLS